MPRTPHAPLQTHDMTPSEQRLIRFTLATIWLITGLVTLFIYPKENSMALLARVGLFGTPAVVMLYGGALLDIVFGVLTLGMHGKRLWMAQAGLIIIYTLIITIRLPEFLIHPFGPILKNLPILALLCLLYKNEKKI